MKPDAELLALRDHPNVKAWQRLIRHGESNAVDGRAYQALYGWTPKRPDRLFTDFSRHPERFFVVSDGRRTSAAGAYQITRTTWREMVARRPACYPDFSPASQDFFVIDRTDVRHALEDVLAGRLTDAIVKCRSEWTSLPGAIEGRYTLDEAYRIFRAWGGRTPKDKPR